MQSSIENKTDSPAILDSHSQWHAARIGREIRESHGSEDAVKTRIKDAFGLTYFDDAIRFAIPAFLGEKVPDLDGPRPE